MRNNGTGKAAEPYGRRQRASGRAIAAPKGAAREIRRIIIGDIEARLHGSISR